MTDEPDVRQPPDVNDPPSENVDELAGGMRGTWVVASQGSTHLWDLDALTYMRRPGPASPSGAFDYDGIAHRITGVTRWPRVGDQSLVWFDDPASPFDTEQFSRRLLISFHPPLTPSPVLPRVWTTSRWPVPNSGTLSDAGVSPAVCSLRRQQGSTVSSSQNVTSPSLIGPHSAVRLWVGRPTRWQR